MEGRVQFWKSDLGCSGCLVWSLCVVHLDSKLPLMPLPTNSCCCCRSEYSWWCGAASKGTRTLAYFKVGSHDPSLICAVPVVYYRTRCCPTLPQPPPFTYTLSRPAKTLATHASLMPGLMTQLAQWLCQRAQQRCLSPTGCEAEVPWFMVWFPWWYVHTLVVCCV